MPEVKPAIAGRASGRYVCRRNTGREDTLKAPAKSAARMRAPIGTIHRSIELLRTALEDLGAAMPLPEVERLGILINEAMSAPARSFHTPQHVIELADPHSPHTTLGALFHDLVYYQVDHGLHPLISAALFSTIESREKRLWLRPAAETTDRALALTMGVFGFTGGQRLEPSAGMNEFLSALVMNSSLAAVVPEADLMLSTACIEATIPFRTTDAEGRTAAERLEQRLAATAREMGIRMPQDRILQGVRWAVTFANRDVANFAEKEVTRFLDNTWKLLPETNPSLRTQGGYTIRSYREALRGMEGFLRSLDPRTIFAQYRGAPPADEYRTMARRGERNVGTAREYLGMKLLTAAILEALALVSGGDAPVAFFMGELDARQRGSRLEDYLPGDHLPRKLPLDAALLDLLSKGRASASPFDLQNSPLSLFIYLRLGTEGVRRHLTSAYRLFDGELQPREFLDELPGPMIAAIASACGHMAFTRAQALMAYAEHASTRSA
jgi:hypothetical protein